MANNPLVSIIIPCYNHEKYIKDCLDSILTDTYLNKEVVIINDGSNDSSDLEILKWINNNNVIKITYLSRENRGVCSTLNQLILLAKGKYILPLASDDMLCNDTIAERVLILENNPSKLVLLSDAAVINSNGKIVMTSSMQNYHKVCKLNYYSFDGILRQTMVSLGVSGATLLVNKKIYDLVGLYPEKISAEDWYFYQRAAAMGKIMFWDRIVSFYRVHSFNTSSATNPKIFSAILTSFIINYKIFPSTKYKILAIKQIVKFSLIYMKVRIKIILK